MSRRSQWLVSTERERLAACCDSSGFDCSFARVCWHCLDFLETPVVRVWGLKTHFHSFFFHSCSLWIPVYLTAQRLVGLLRTSLKVIRKMCSTFPNDFQDSRGVLHGAFKLDGQGRSDELCKEGWWRCRWALARGRRHVPFENPRIPVNGGQQRRLY